MKNLGIGKAGYEDRDDSGHVTLEGVALTSLRREEGFHKYQLCHRQ